MGQAESRELLDNLPTVAECYESSDAMMATFINVWAKDAPHASERILSVTWPKAMSIAADSSFTVAMGRTLPWNYFHQDDSNILETVLKLRASSDSCHPSTQDGVDPLLKLTGTPRHSQYVDRRLPCFVIDDSRDSHPTNATPWDEMRDLNAKINVRIPHVELARCHAGEEGLREDCHGTSAEGYDPNKYVPIVTKAGSRLWSLGFASPDTQVTELRASYPGQLLVRIDKAGGNIIYDCFEFKLVCKDAFSAQMQSAQDGRGEWPISIDGLEQAERLMADMRFFDMPTFRSETGVNEITPLDRDASFSDRCKRLGTTRLYVLANWSRYKKSRLMRVWFPMDTICGTRLVTIDYDRPHQDIPPVVRRLSTS